MADSKTKFGFDVLGLAMFGTAAQAIPKGYAIGVFSRTFGDSLPAVERLTKAGKCSVLRVHLTWSDNNHTYDDRHFNVIEREAERWNKFAQAHPNVDVYLSPFCEHNLSNPDIYLRKVKKAADRCTPVNSPYLGALSGNFINEVHGVKAKPPGRNYIFSYDGDDICESDVPALKERHRDAKLWFAWTANFNGRKEANDKTPRSDRTNWPSEKLIASLDYVMSKAKDGGRLPPHWFWQSHGEDLGTPDVGADKPMLVTPEKFDVVELVKGKTVIASAKRSSIPYGDRRYRFLFPQWGYELSRRAGGVLDVRAGGKIHGSVNPAFCQGNVPVYQ